jgi:hypothetical protein
MSDVIVATGEGRSIATISKSFSVCNYKPVHFFDVLQNNTSKLLDDKNSLLCCTIVLWSLSVLGLMKQYETMVHVLWKDVLSKLENSHHFNDAISDTNSDDDSLESIAMLLQVYMHSKVEGVMLDDISDAVKQDMVRHAQRHYSNNRGTNEVKYSDILSSLGYEIKKQHSVVKDLNGVGEWMALDIVIEEKRIGFEYDGIHHYLTDLSDLNDGVVVLNQGKETGQTVAKRRIIESEGWTIINIPWYDDAAMESDEDKRRDYVVKRLREVGVVVD